MNDRKMLKSIRKQSPEAYFEWTLNGVFINVGDRVTFQGDDVHIKTARPQDAGVYVSMIYRPNNHRVVLKVISLAVRAANYDVDTRATLTYVLQCHSVILGYVYADLSLTLTVNNATYRDHGVTTLAAVNAHQLDPLNESNSGAWQCVVEQKDLNLHWVTNHVRLNVKKAPNFFTHLMEDRLTAPIFGLFRTERAVLAAVICLTVAVFCAVAGCLVLYLKFCHLEARAKRANRRFQ
uniref:Ig-like domain-containing protein n=1 Tax=Dendroctonus ponderosae TaxID=77166 RepID=A0AAR5P0K6_DENPD